jgi:hypothetical protein
MHGTHFARACSTHVLYRAFYIPTTCLPYFGSQYSRAPTHTHTQRDACIGVQALRRRCAGGTALHIIQRECRRLSDPWRFLNAPCLQRRLQHSFGRDLHKRQCRDHAGKCRCARHLGRRLHGYGRPVFDELRCRCHYDCPQRYPLPPPKPCQLPHVCPCTLPIL